MRCGLAPAGWLRDGFDLGKRRRRSSTPAVVPGAAPALAKAGAGGYRVECKFERFEHDINTLGYKYGGVY